MQWSVKNIMLTLINIIKNENGIEADYIPENGDKRAHIQINTLNNVCYAEDIQPYGSMYSRMAINGLKKILSEIQKGIIAELPKKRVVMWY